MTLKTSTTQYLKNYLKALSDYGYFNGSVLVAKDDNILLQQDSGLASFQYEVPVTQKTKFRIGSLSKAFTAAGILILVEEGKIELTTTIDTFFSDYPEGNRITIHHLLSHSSGIADFTSSPDYWSKMMRLPATIDQLIDSLKDIHLEFSPGERMEYCNSGYLLLTAMIEKASGLTYSEFLKEKILSPLQMNDTGVDDGRTIISHLATGHTVHKTVIHSEFIDMSFPLGAYGLYSTVEDLYKWGKALMQGRVVNQELVNKMFIPNLDGYGYGWFLVNDNEKIASHSGDINGFVSDFVMYLESKVMVIVLSNLNLTPVEKMSKDLANIVFGKEIKSVSTIPSNSNLEINLPQFIGVYEGEDASPLLIEKKSNNSLYITVTKTYGVPYTYPINLLKVEGNRIVCKAEFVNETVTFYLDEGQIKLHYEDCYGRERQLVKK